MRCRRSLSVPGSTACASNTPPPGFASGSLCPRSPGWRGSALHYCCVIGKGSIRVAELTVVIPAFRERENIPPLLTALEKALEGLEWEAIVVVDDAFDGTEEWVRNRAQSDPRVRCLHRIGRRGLASACIEGMLASSAPYIAVIDADLQHDETLLPGLLEAAKSEQADLVVASRYMEGASTGELAAQRVRISQLASSLSRVLAKGLTDPM